MRLLVREQDLGMIISPTTFLLLAICLRKRTANISLLFSPTKQSSQYPDSTFFSEDPISHPNPTEANEAPSLPLPKLKY
ncbi:hypothetical protein CEXT_174471 [Caerostris extrusa]|uniref:Uncharacterized protein n=1 Tax=Caerostris extrusa TaxID=172846 RepID=A0AAV4TPF0_CAEEX|nr:hypothetical protein CEXT_174471 [Caerostris extrusa]